MSARLLSRRDIFAIMPLVVGVPGCARSATMKPASPRSAEELADAIGLCTHFSARNTPYIDRFEEVFAALRPLKIRRLRDEAIFGDMGKDKSVSGHYDRIRQCVSAGFTFSLICADRANPYRFTPPAALPAIYDWSDRGVDQFEGSNEPALTKIGKAGIRQSAVHQSALWKRMRQSSTLRDIPLLGPSYVQADCDLAPDQSRTSSFGNVHTYPGLEHPETTGAGSLLSVLARSRRTYRGLPFQATETGYHTALATQSGFRPVSVAAKTRYLPRQIFWHALNDVKRVYVYESVVSWNRGATDPESHFGLLTFDLQPTPSYHALNNLIALLRSRRKPISRDFPPLTLRDPDQHMMLLRQSGGGLLCAAWLGLPCWGLHSTETAPPVERSMQIDFGHIPRVVIAHRFLDDGTIRSSRIAIGPGLAQLAVSDQLTIFEL